MSVQPDRFEVIRDCRACYLKLLGALLRTAGVVSAGACQAVLDGVGRHYDAMTDSTRRASSFREGAQGLTSSRITLIGDDELELGIRLDNLAGRLFDAAGPDLWRTHLRFVNLLGRPDLAKADNPVGPHGIGEGLSAMFHAVEASSLDKKLDLLDRLEGQLLDGLPTLYAALNEFLEQAGVTAAAATIITAPEAPRGGRREAANAAPNVLLALHDGLLARLNGNADRTGADHVAGATLLSPAAIDNLLFRLDDLERAASGQIDFLTSTAPDLESLIPGLFAEQSAAAIQPPRRPLNSRQLGVPAATAEGLAIDSVALICDTMLADPTLPEVLKSVLSSLQITLVKVAIRDASLFVDPAHPCRQAIDRIGQAGLGLPREVTAQHPVCARLLAIASALRSAGAGQAACAEALAALDRLIAERHAAIDQAAAAYLPLFAQLERRDQAAGAVNALFERLPVDQEPDQIRGFLEHTWRPLLEQIWLTEGPASDTWQIHGQTIESLLWSFQPKLDGAARQALSRELPGVLRVLRNGMERMKLDAEQQAAVLDACFARQRDAIRRPAASAAAAPDAAAPLAAPPIQRPPRQVTADSLKAGVLVLRTLDLAGGAAPPRLPACAVGDWLEISVAGARQPLRVCQRSGSGRSLLFNPDLPLALAIHPQLLEQQLRAGEASKLGERGLFDAAAARALQETRA
jgi:hypothetical protein